MRPLLVAEYRRIVAEYKRDGSGIYDDTPDLHRAIAWSDAYYGDWSSLVTLFGVTGKHVVIQNIAETGNEILLQFADFSVDDDGVIWGFELFEDGLFKLDFENNTASFTVRSGNSPKYSGKYVSGHKYVGVCCAGEDVICFPYFIDNILIYNRLSGKKKKVSLNRSYLLSSVCDDGFCIKSTIYYQSKIYAFGDYLKAIVVFDVLNQSVHYDVKLFERIGLLAYSKDAVKYPFYMSDCSEDGKVTLLMRNCEYLIVYTLSTQEIEFVASNPLLSRCVIADFDGQDFWLISEKYEKLIKWNPHSNIVTKYDLIVDGFNSLQSDYVFSGISDCGDFLILFPGHGKKLLKFDKETENISEYTEMPVSDKNSDDISNYGKPKCFRDKVYAFARHNFTTYELNKSTGKVTQHQFRLADESHSSFINSYFDNIHISVNKSSLGNIAEFFAGTLKNELITNNERHENIMSVSAKKDGSAGKNIINYTKMAAI